MSESVTSAIIAKWIALGVFSTFGGITHSLVEKRAGRTKGFADECRLAFISGFCGVMWGLVAHHYSPSDFFVWLFAAGMGGFMSLEGLALVATYIKKRFLTIEK